jgi:hypothetical protein
MVLFLVKENKRTGEIYGKVDCEPCWNVQDFVVEKFDKHFLEEVLPYIKCTKCGARAVEPLPEGVADPGYQGAVPGESTFDTTKKGVYLTPKDLLRRFGYVWKPL